MSLFAQPSPSSAITTCFQCIELVGFFASEILYVYNYHTELTLMRESSENAQATDFHIKLCLYFPCTFTELLKDDVLL